MPKRAQKADSTGRVATWLALRSTGDAGQGPTRRGARHRGHVPRRAKALADRARQASRVAPGLTETCASRYRCAQKATSVRFSRSNFQRSVGSHAREGGEPTETEVKSACVRYTKVHSSFAGPGQVATRNEISPCDTRAYANHCKVVRRPAKIISGEDRIRTCGGLTPSRI